MDSKLLVGLIKEVVKNEVKQQVKEELTKLIKSGAVTLNKEKKQSSLMEMTEVQPPVKRMVQTQPIINKPKKDYSTNPILNEVLNMTQPFTAEQRKEGAMAVNSVLDMLQPQKTMEEDWETMDYRTQSTPQQLPSTGNAGLDAIQKALNRDYTDLTKVFTKQEKQKGLR